MDRVGGKFERRAGPPDGERSAQEPAGATAARPVRVLFVGEGDGARPRVSELLAAEPAVEVAVAAGSEAIQDVIRTRPDCVCLDLDAPGLDALALLRELMARAPVPVVVLSASGSQPLAFRALELGALEAVVRPSHPAEEGAFRDDLRVRLVTLRALHVDGDRDRVTPRLAGRGAPRRLVVVGAPHGSGGAIAELLAAVPGRAEVAVVVATHPPAPVGEGDGVRPAGEGTAPPPGIAHAEDGRQLCAGDVLAAPAGQHVLVERSQGAVRLRVLSPPEVAGRRHCPSIDLLLESAARVFADRTCGVLLSGTRGDGRRGAEAIRAAGGVVMAEVVPATTGPVPGSESGREEVLSRTEIGRRVNVFAAGA